MAINTRMRGSGRISDPCGSGQIADCNGTCFPDYFYNYSQGDGMCDDGAPGSSYINLNCAAFDYDGGDCGTPYECTFGFGVPAGCSPCEMCDMGMCLYAGCNDPGCNEPQCAEGPGKFSCRPGDLNYPACLKKQTSVRQRGGRVRRQMGGGPKPWNGK